MCLLHHQIRIAEKRTELTAHLASNGLTVLLTHDYDAILLQLARLAQFERLIVKFAEVDKSGLVKDAIQSVHDLQYYPVEGRPLDILDIPTILAGVNKALHAQLDKGAHINTERLYAAASAFVGILSVEVR